MPRKPMKPCSYQGCPRLTYGRYCDEHAKLMNAQYDARCRDRGASEFYHSTEWRRCRQNFLIEHPFCEECRKHGRLTRATLVDHIVPIRQGGAALDENNLQALCSSCHGRKSIEDGSRFSR
jgi:5-methylcytosine-specific restriction enzyme A